MGRDRPSPPVAPPPGVQRRQPSAYPAGAWTLYAKKIDRDIAARGMQLTLALIPPAPVWATGTGDPKPQTQPVSKPSAAQFLRFARAVGTRYGGQFVPAGETTPLPRLTHWSVWNEPDEGFQLGPQLVPHTQVESSPRMYRALVDAAWSALHTTGHGGDSILIGEIASTGQTFPGAPGLFGAMAPLRFLRALYCVGADYKTLTSTAAAQRVCPATAAASAHFAADHPGLFHASGFATHPYPQGLAPNAVTPNEPDYTELAATGSLESALDRLNQAYGSHTRYKIYSTEFQVSFDEYLISDPPSGVFATGLFSAAGTPKPLYAAYRMPPFLPSTSTSTSTRKGHPLLVWGCVRPAHYLASRR